MGPGSLIWLNRAAAKSRDAVPHEDARAYDTSYGELPDTTCKLRASRGRAAPGTVPNDTGECTAHRELHRAADRRTARTHRALSRRAAHPNADRVDLSAAGRGGGTLAQGTRAGGSEKRRADQGTRAARLGSERQIAHSLPAGAIAARQQPGMDTAARLCLRQSAERGAGQRPAAAAAGDGRGWQQEPVRRPPRSFRPPRTS